MKDRILGIVGTLILCCFILAYVGIVSYSVIWDFPQRTPLTVGRHYSTGAFITPTPYPPKPTELVVPQEPDAGAVINVDMLGRGTWWVCIPEVAVRGGPHDFMPILYMLQYGDKVQIGETTHSGWGMMRVPEWVPLTTLCR